MFLTQNSIWTTCDNELFEIIVRLTIDIKKKIWQSTIHARKHWKDLNFHFASVNKQRQLFPIVRVLLENACIKCLSSMTNMPFSCTSFPRDVIEGERMGRIWNLPVDCHCQRWKNIDNDGREVYRIYLLIYANNNFRFSFLSSKRKLTRVCSSCLTSLFFSLFLLLLQLLQSRRLSMQSWSDVISFFPSTFS